MVTTVFQGQEITCPIPCEQKLFFHYIYASVNSNCAHPFPGLSSGHWSKLRYKHKHKHKKNEHVCCSCAYAYAYIAEQMFSLAYTRAYAMLMF